MTKNLFLYLAVLSFLIPKLLLAQEDTIETSDTTTSSPSEELTDEPQTLSAEVPPMPETQSIPTNNTEELTEDENIEKINNDKIPQDDLQKRTGVISEEELLKPKNPKPAQNKVRSQQQTSEAQMYIQDSTKYKLTDVYKNLQLNDVIEQGLRKNYDQSIKGQKQELNELAFSGAKSAFWLPELQVTLKTDNQKIANLKNSSRAPTNPNSTSPSGALGLSLGDYTVFNWGKDYALYLNKKSVYDRETQIFNESKRELKLDLINSFFTLMSSKNIEKIRQEELRQASFVYRLRKEKITIGKTSKQDYY